MIASEKTRPGPESLATGGDPIIGDSGEVGHKVPLWAKPAGTLLEPNQRRFRVPVAAALPP
jgi:hypothetical protein